MPPVSYDANCDPANTADCKARVIISAERLMDPATGRAENHKIGNLLNQTAGVQETLIDEVAWDCLYDLLIGDNPDGLANEDTDGYNDYRSREGIATRKHVVSTRHLTKMIQQLTRLINKYSAYDLETNLDWSVSETAASLVEILTEHRDVVQAELDETSTDQLWAHPPKPNWVIEPKCAASRHTWDYNYPHASSGFVNDMFPGTT